MVIRDKVIADVGEVTLTYNLSTPRDVEVIPAVPHRSSQEVSRAWGLAKSLAYRQIIAKKLPMEVQLAFDKSIREKIRALQDLGMGDTANAIVGHYQKLKQQLEKK